MITINDGLFNEIGVDSQDRKKKFSKINRKKMSLFIRMDNRVKLFLSGKFNKPSEMDEKEFLYDLFEKNEDLCELLDLIIHSSKSIDKDKAKEIYEKEFHRIESSIQKILLEGYFDEEKDLLRKIHYYTFIKTQKNIEANGSIDLQNDSRMESLDENSAQELLRSCKELKQNKKIKVWYTLRTDDGIAFFIYVDAKSRKKVPSIVRKRNTFIKYSKPNVIYLMNDGKKLLIYSKDVDRNLKYASAIIYETSTKEEPFKVCFDIEEKLTKKSNINHFIKELIDSKTEGIKLESIVFYPDSAKYGESSIALNGAGGRLNKLLTDLKAFFGIDNITASIIQELKISFNGYHFTLVFWENGNNLIINYSHQFRDQSIAQEFTTFLESKYSLFLNKKAQ